MEEIIAAAWRVFGPAVLGWTVKQLRDWWEGQGQSFPPVASSQLADPCRVHYCGRPGANLDPDDGVFYWDLPEQEQ